MKISFKLTNCNLGLSSFSCKCNVAKDEKTSDMHNGKSIRNWDCAYWS